MTPDTLPGKAAISTTQTARQLPILALFGASAVSLIGNQLAALAIPWFVLQTTGSAVKTGLVGFSLMLATMLASFTGGPVVDRLGPKRASILADVTSGATVALVPLLFRLDVLAFGTLLMLVFIGALLDTPGATARQVLLPDLAALSGLRKERANGIFESVENAAVLVGPALAGLLVAAVGVSQVLWLDAASFAFSAALIAVAVPAPPPGQEAEGRGEPREPVGGYWADVVIGLRFVWHDRVLRALCAVAALGNLLFTPLFAVILPVYAERTTGSAAALGALIAAFGGGLLAGSLAFGAAGHRLPRRATMAASLAATGVAIAGFALAPSFPWAIAAMAVGGLAGGPFNPLVYTVMQERVRPELRGRVFGPIIGAALAAAPLGMLLAGVLIESIGLTPLIVLVAAALLIGGAALALAPAFRELAGTASTMEKPPPGTAS